MASPIDRIISVESGGDPDARNPNSSASGPAQFIDSTWLDTISKHRPDLLEGKSQDDILAMKSDPQLSREMAGAYASDNAGMLSKAGLPVTNGSLYLSHFAGPRGAIGLLNADPNAPAASILGQGFAKANPTLAGYSAGQLAAWADRKMGGAGAPMSMAGPRTASSSQPEPQQQAAPQSLPQIGGGAPAPNLAALGAVPQLANLLPARPNPLGVRVPFSLRG